MRPTYLQVIPAVLVVSVAIGGMSAGTMAVAANAPFLAHQAGYDLALVKSRRSPSIDGARGRILYNFTGNGCEGYSTEFRQLSEIDTGEGRMTQSEMRSTSWEAGDGKSYRFHIETRTNDKDPETIDGFAERSDTAVTVKLTRPDAKTLTLDPNVVFPTEQVERIVAAAREGKSLLELNVYDGSDGGEKVFNTLSVIGQPIPGDRVPAKPDVATAHDALKSMTRWPVTVSYFDKSEPSKAGEQTPIYAMSFELYENGVSRALVLDYNDFILGGSLASFDAKPDAKADVKVCK